MKQRIKELLIGLLVGLVFSSFVIAAIYFISFLLCLIFGGF